MSNFRKLALSVTGAFMCAGFIAWLYQINNGLAVTNMSNSFSWGLYIAGFAFFVGNAAGGMVLSASIYMFGLSQLKPFARLGAVTALANVIAAIVSVVVDVGQPFRLLNMLLYPNFSSPIIWDVIILNAYAALILVYLYILMLPDLAGRFKKIALKVKNPKEFSDKWAKRLAPVALVFAAGIHVVTSWIFSTQGAREWWHTAVLSPDFVAVAVAAGTTVVFLFSVILYGKGENFAEAHKTMVKFIFTAFVFHLFLMYNDFFIKLWYGSEIATEPIFITLKKYGPIHAFEVFAPIFGIIILFNYKKLKTKFGLIAGSVFILAGILAHRFLLLPAAFNEIPLTFKPFGLQEGQWTFPIASGRYSEGANTFVTWWDYWPSIYEILIFSGITAFMIFFVTVVYSVLLEKKPEIMSGKPLKNAVGYGLDA